MSDEIKSFNKLQIVYLSNHGSSGNTFFLSLLDGHTQILNLPGYIDFNFIFRKERNFRDYLDAFTDSNPFFFDTTKMKNYSKNHQGLFFLGENCDEGIKIDRDLFTKLYLEFTKNIPLSEKNIILALYYAYAKSINKEINKVKYLIIYAYDHQNTIRFINRIGNGDVIVLSRNLFNNYISFEKKLITKLDLRNLHSNEILNDNMNYLYNTSKNVTPLIKAKVNFSIIRIEDLHNEPEKVMKKFCLLIKINYDLSLLESSFGGKKYNGHSWDHDQKKLKKFSGFNKNYHNISQMNKLREVEKIQILFIGYFYLISLKYVDNKNIKFLLIKNFLYIFYPNKYENKFLRKNKNIFSYIKSRLKFIIIFLYQFKNKEKIRKSILKI